jgi:polar amino acid transport system substrate-binding protein
MRKAKLVVVLLMALALLAACAHGTETGVKSTPVSSFQHILQKGELVVGTAAEMPALNMKTKDGKIIGLEADLARYMAKAMGVKLRFEFMQFSKLLSALESGKVDMILSYMTITPKRNLKVAFVGPYFVSGKAFLTKIETIAKAKEATEVNSPKVRLTGLRGSTSQYFVEKVLPKVQFVPADNYNEAINMVLQDKVNALIADYPICVTSVFRYPNQGLLTVVTPLTYEPLGIAVPAGDAHLINWLENFLNSLEETGELDELKARWFGDVSWLKELP